MKKLTLLIAGLVISGALFFSCEEEPPPVPTGPTLELVEGSGFVIDTATVNIGDKFTVKVTATAGDSVIERLVVKENGTAISDLSRLTFGGFPAGSNPTPIATGAGFTWEIDILVHDVPDVTSTYTIEITDQGGLSDDVSVDITSRDPGTPVAVSEMVMLLNQGGPSGTGGLDLHTGTGTGTTAQDTAADIRDLGIDLVKPLADNWIQKIGTINGSLIAVPEAGFDFDAIQKREQIVPAYEAGSQIAESEKVQVGDVFLVLSKGTYFAIKVTKVQVTPADNQDYYEFTVKQ